MSSQTHHVTVDGETVEFMMTPTSDPGSSYAVDAPGVVRFHVSGPDYRSALREARDVLRSVYHKDDEEARVSPEGQ